MTALPPWLFLVLREGVADGAARGSSPELALRGKCRSGPVQALPRCGEAAQPCPSCQESARSEAAARRRDDVRDCNARMNDTATAAATICRLGRCINPGRAHLVRCKRQYGAQQD